MHRRTTQHHRVPFQLLFVVLLIVSSLVIPHTSYADGEDWQLSPSSISVSVPLGQKVERSITLTNVSGSSGQPNIYEAYPPAPALASRDVPPELQQVELPQQSERLDEELVNDLQEGDNETGDFLVYLDEQPDLSAAYQIDDWAARGQYVYETLMRAAEDSQQDLRADLDARGLPYQPFWIVNAIKVNGTLSDAQALAGRAEVAVVRANRITTVPSVASTTQSEGEELCSPDQPNNPICWHIRRINADRVWQDFGVNGEGVVIANIDTGVRYDHPGLIKQYRGYRESGRLSHNYNWFDPQGEQVSPFDDNGHGTHTMGTIIGVGNAASKRPTVGVAPGAEWMAAQGCNGSFCTEGDL
ncbi:MAG: S8 family serine peptidase, partial [Chloroflexota bacterium]